MKTKPTRFVIGGLGLGDEGKGTIVDYLVRRHGLQLIVRYNGGPQAGHNVVEVNGRQHTFAQFGSGTLVPGVETYLSPFMVVDPLAIKVESEVLNTKGISDALSRLLIDGESVVVTPFHKIINCMQETARGTARHGSCGKGVGQAVLDGERMGEWALRIKDLQQPEVVQRKLDFLWRIKLDLAEQLVEQNSGSAELKEYLQRLQTEDYVALLTAAYVDFMQHSGVRVVDSGYLSGILATDKGVVFEGAQGFLLDENYGFWPHVTKSQTTLINALKLLNGQPAIKLGVLRTFYTRHGAGPLVTETTDLKPAVARDHNQTNVWQGSFRTGWLDLILAKYAVREIGVLDALALTHTDSMAGLGAIKVCTAYRYGGKNIGWLDTYFDWKKEADGVIKITGIKRGAQQQPELTQLLNACQPAEFVEFAGEQSQGTNSKQTYQLIDFLQEALHLPVSILSYGPTGVDKVSRIKLK